MRQPQRLIRGIAAALLACAAAPACHTVRTVAPAQIERSRPPQRIWVTLADQSELLVLQPELAGDTLVGMVYGEPARLSLSDAVSIRARRSAPARTAALAIASGAALVGMFIYLQNRPDVSGASTCYYSIIGSTVNPCCQGRDTLPC